MIRRHVGNISLFLITPFHTSFSTLIFIAHFHIFNLSFLYVHFQLKCLSRTQLSTQDTSSLCLNLYRTLTHANRVVTESDVKFFAESLAEYKRQHEETTKIVENMSVGMLLCDASKLKTKMLPSPQKCLEVFNIFTM